MPAGVTPTGNYNEKTLHCGAGFRNRFVNPSISVAVTQREAPPPGRRSRSTCCVHMCPNCHMQFDRYHDIISASAREEYPFVHLHVQQLLALALGADPEKDVGVQIALARTSSPSSSASARAAEGGRAMRAGVFLCQCGGNISGVLDLEALAEHVKHARGRHQRRHQPVHVRHRGASAHLAGRRGARPRPPRVASCSPRFQGPTFERIARDLRLGENAVAFANLREGCSFIHKDEPELRAGEGAQDRRRRRRAGAAPERPAAPPHLPAPLGACGRRRHRRHDRRRGARRAAASRCTWWSASQSLGGYMARLSKTFPTEDCAMCSLAPRLTSTALEGRVHVHTLTEVDEISGPPGEFRVKLRHKPRYVSEACVGCGECVPVCPVKYPNDFDFGVSERKAIDRPVRQRRAQHVRRREEGLEPLQERLRRAHVGPGLRGAGRRRPLRGRLPRGQRAEPVQQRLRAHLHAPLRDRLRARQGRRADRHRRPQALRRRHGRTDVPVQPAPVIHEERVAIVGAGPAGLTCARDLAHLGYKVTVLRGAAGRRRHAAHRHPRLPPAARRHPARDRPGARAGHRAQARPARRRRLHRRRPLRAGLQGRLPGHRPAEERRGRAPGRRPRRRDPRRRAAARAQPRRHAAGGRQGRRDRRRRRSARRRPLRHPPAAAGRQGARRDARLPAQQVEMPANASEVEEAREEGLKVEFLVQPLAIVGGERQGRRRQAAALRAGRRPTSPAAASRSPSRARSSSSPPTPSIFAVGQALVDDFAAGLRRPGARGRPDLRRPRHDDDDARRRVRRRRRRRPRLLHGHRGRGGRPQGRGRHPQLPARRAPAAGVGRRARGRAAQRRGTRRHRASGQRVPMAMVDGLDAPRATGTR